MSAILMRVYAGGESGVSANSISCAISAILKQFEASTPQILVETKGIQEIRSWSPSELVDWLLGSDVHIIGTHMHQGIPRWNAAHVWLELQRLKGHHGFPTGDNLMCPVFTQHKFHYLCALRSFVAPTLAVKFPQVDRVVDMHGNERISSTVDSASSFNVDDLDSFLGSHMETGWVVKLPFTTVHEGMSFCLTKDEVYSALCVKAQRFAWRIPYALVQPRLSNRREYKVVTLNGKASHVIPEDANGVKVSYREKKNFSTAPHTELMLFAEMAVRYLVQMCNGTISEYLIRVDVMQLDNGMMIVNEFESFEAVYTASCHEKTCHVQQFLNNFWLEKLTSLVNAVVK